MDRGPLKLFLSYAHEDRDLVTELRKHLAPLRHEQIVADWYDREVMAGQDWDREIRAQLESSDLVIVVVSADFVASDYAYGRELALALRLHDQGRLRLLPVIGRNCKWQNLPLARLQVLPEGAVPISSWDQRDDALVSVVVGVERVAREILSSGDSLVDDWLTSRLLRRRVLIAVQQQLKRIGLYTGPIDGIAGPATEGAVIEFQRRAGITVDAMIGPEVIRRLEEDVSHATHERP
ncbi:MAG: TIR domain-containing protein [Haloechinothrix sp.]